MEELHTNTSQPFESGGIRENLDAILYTVDRQLRSLQDALDENRSLRAALRNSQAEPLAPT